MGASRNAVFWRRDQLGKVCSYATLNYTATTSSVGQLAQKTSCLLVSLRPLARFVFEFVFEAKPHAVAAVTRLRTVVLGADITAVQRSAERPVETTCFLAYWQVPRSSAQRGAQADTKLTKWPSPTPGSPTRRPSSRSF